MKKISVRIPYSMYAEILELVESGEFSSISEVVRAALEYLTVNIRYFYREGEA